MSTFVSQASGTSMLDVGGLPAQERLLHGVLGLRGGAEQAVGDGLQAGPEASNTSTSSGWISSSTLRTLTRRPYDASRSRRPDQAMSAAAALRTALKAWSLSRAVATKPWMTVTGPVRGTQDLVARAPSAARAISSSSARVRADDTARALCGVELSRPNVAWARRRSSARSVDGRSAGEHVDPQVDVATLQVTDRLAVLRRRARRGRGPARG